MAQLYSAGRQLIGSEVGEDCSDDRILEDIQVVAFVSLDSVRFILDPFWAFLEQFDWLLIHFSIKCVFEISLTF